VRGTSESSECRRQRIRMLLSHALLNNSARVA
jgi:hypothetical protein